MTNHQLINQTSGKTEYYTPPEIVEAARALMGSIDLDPASSKRANKTIKANQFFTEQENGLDHPWFGNVWMNHPFLRETNKLWIENIIREYEVRHVVQACCITFASTSEKWFQPLLNFPQCYLSPRTNYYLPDSTKKKGVTKGSVVTFLPPRNQNYFETIGKFRKHFCKHGKIMLPY